MDLQNVLTFRDLADVSAMRALMRQGARAAVIGGGLLGIEAAYGLAKAGVKVALVHLMDRLMERQLDERAALLLKRAIEAEGIEVPLGADTKRVLGEDRATGLELSDARVVPADFVVCAVDIRPNAELAREAGLRSTAGSWSMTGSPPATRMSSPLANARSIGAASPASLNRPTNRPGFWRAASPATGPWPIWVRRSRRI
jgi:NAD(P)H-nitrite reductase large subunit